MSFNTKTPYRPNYKSRYDKIFNTEIVEQSIKFCSKCKNTKPLSDFSKNRNTKDGLHNNCKVCKSTYENKDRNKEKAKKWIGKNLEKYLLLVAKHRAKQSQAIFDLTIEDIKIPEKCPLLNIPLYRGTRKDNNASPSIDRIDFEKGYTKENVWIISKLANSIKHTATPEQIIQVGINLKQFLEKRNNIT